ncbi:MAG: hypothetical protein KBD53_11870 [Candidatus Omnitrophica bacterium]|nr:hypothetical protein [Candidatus Omnitrophota bacterium]
MFCLTAFGGALTVAIYWANNKVPFVDFDMYEKMSKNTDWVKEELDLYLVNENILVSMDLNGKDQTKVFQVEEEIRDFQFSPDGKYILISTYTGIYVYDRANKSHWLVDSVSLTPDLDDVKGTISGISWSPTSKYFSYEKSRWSNFGSQSSVYVYQIDSPEKRPIKSPTMELSSLHWDSTGENLYFLKHGSNELDENKIIYKIQLYRIALSDLNVQLVTDISMDENKFPTPHLEMLGIHLYQPYKSLSYARIRDYEELVSKKGDVIGIDEYNFLYYKDKWFRKRLFKVKREVDNTKLPTYLNTQGEPVLQQIRWTPSGKYVVMDHPYWGILILDPKHRKIGQLYPFEVSAYGWYSKE